VVRVTPYLRQCGPPEFSATVAPTLQASGWRGRGVVVTVGANLIREPDIDQAGFDDGALVSVVHLEHAVHPVEADDDAAFEGQRPAGEARPCSSGHERNALPHAQADDLGDLGGALGRTTTSGVAL